MYNFNYVPAGLFVFGQGPRQSPNEPHRYQTQSYHNENAPIYQRNSYDCHYREPQRHHQMPQLPQPLFQYSRPNEYRHPMNDRREFGKDRTNFNFSSNQNEHAKKTSEKVQMKPLIYFKEIKYHLDAVPLSGHWSVEGHGILCKKYDFYITEEEKDNNSHILRFARCGSTTEKAGDIFPSDLKVYVNDSRFPISLRNSFDSFGKPIDISLHCRARINHISVSWRNEKSIQFCWSLVRCKRRSYDEIMKGRAVSEHEKTAKLIKENFKTQDDITTTNVIVPLICPVAQTRIKVPCKGKDCNHLQVFDGETFLRMNESKSVNSWKCLVCSKSLPFDDLTVDGYFKKVLEHPDSADVQEVVCFEDGSWEPGTGGDVTEDRSECEHSIIDLCTPIKPAAKSRLQAGSAVAVSGGADEDASFAEEMASLIIISDTEEEENIPQTPPVKKSAPKKKKKKHNVASSGRKTRSSTKRDQCNGITLNVSLSESWPATSGICDKRQPSKKQKT